MIEPEGGIAGDLDVLALVVADRDLIGVVEQDVGGLQSGVGEEPAADEVLLAFGRLVLELCHPRQLAKTDGALHDPAQLVVLGHMALDEHSCDFWVEAHCEEHGGQLNRSLTDDPWFVGHGERMQVDDAVERIVAMLSSDPGLQRTEVVPEVDITRRLHARQHAGLGRRCCWIGHVRDDTAGLTAASVSFPQMVDVATPVYEGPFDLLLQLILKEQVDIYEINLSTIVDAYLVELERLAELDLDIATSFLLIAATLVDLKARRLLPNTGDIDLDDELALWEERDMLLARLLEAKTFKDVAGVFARLADEADKTFPRVVGPDERFNAVLPDMLEGTSLKRFQNAAIKALTPRPKPVVDLYHVNPIKVTVADAVAELLDELPRVGKISFRRLTSQFADRIDVIVRFLALLELFKQGAVELEQPERFGDIDVVWSVDEDFDTDSILIDAYEG